MDPGMATVPCDVPGCKTRWKTPSALRKHKKRAYEVTPIPRRVARCNKFFTIPSSEVWHYRDADSKHQKVPEPRVPFTITGCNKTYQDARGLDLHTRRDHEGVRYPCPFEGCDLVFTMSATAENLFFFKAAHQLMFPCLHPHCTKRFKTALEAWDHSLNGSHTLEKVYVCVSKNCNAAIAGKRFSASSARSHQQIPHAVPEVTGTPSLGETVESDILPWGGPREIPPVLSSSRGNCDYQISTEPGES
jgi:hypothetical protein